MPECAFHPGVETNVRCAECERPICTKDMVSTPVGYKCRECARPVRSARAYVKPRQYAVGAAAGLAVAVGGGLLLSAASFGFILVDILFGALIAEAVRRGSGGHRVPSLAAVAGVCGALGGLIAGDLLSMLITAAAAAILLQSGRW